MKPIKLIIEGINSFTDAQELDFEEVGRSNLFCICGKTGAGKTTIFDSIMLALFGKSGKGNLADTVNLSRTSASVAFEFEAGDDMYRIERTIKCRNEKNADGEPTGRRLAMSADCMMYKNGEPYAKGSDEVTSRVIELVGLEEGEFKNVYLLEQGEYADFLKQTPAKQLETVGKIFSLMRFGDVHKLANAKRTEAEGDAKGIEGRISDLGEVSTEVVRAAKLDLASLKSKSTALSKDIAARKQELADLEEKRLAYTAVLEKQKIVAEHAKRLDEANERLKSAAAAELAFNEAHAGDETETMLKELRAKNEKLAALNAIDRECAAAENDCAKKSADLAKKSDELNRAQAELKKKEDVAEADKAAFERDIQGFLSAAANVKRPSESLSRAVENVKQNGNANVVTSCYYELRDEKDGYDRLINERDRAAKTAEKCEEKAADELKKTEAYVAELESAKREEQAAIDGAKKAEDDLSAAQLSSHAAAIAAELHAGDKCPVCGGVYDGHAHENADVEQKKLEKENAEKVKKQAEARVLKLERYVENSKADYARISREGEESRQKADELSAQAEATLVEPEIYKEMLSCLSHAKSSGEKSEKSDAACRELGPKIASLIAECDGVKNALFEAEQKAKELAEKVGDMRGRTDAEIAEVKREIDRKEKEQAALELERKKLAAEKDGAAATVKAVEEMLAAARRECPAESPEFDEDEYKAKREAAGDIEQKLIECNADIARREEALSSLEQKLEKLKSLKAELDNCNKRVDRYKIISDMTKSKAMLNFVATEYIQGFTDEASDILSMLSGGKYTMRYDLSDGFVVSDYLNDGKTRKTDTLSGGEMFLASLAVAIAISREQSVGDNGFFFLDEGFGTLDEELIDTVYGALEELARSCLVGVISHSNALIDRMPARVTVIEATDTAGSKIEY